MRPSKRLLHSWLRKEVVAAETGKQGYEVTTVDRHRCRHKRLWLVPLSMLLLAGAAIALQMSEVSLVSRQQDGSLANGDSSQPAVSPDGRLIVFASEADNLVEGDTARCGDGSCRDIILYDRSTDQMVGITTGGGVEANGPSDEPVISTDGRVIAFVSEADNLVPADNNGQPDIFVVDRSDGQLRRVDVSSQGEQSNGPSRSPVLSSDGRFVAFESDASNLVEGDENERTDVFVHDRQLGTTERVSVSSEGVEGNGFSRSPAISDDGRHVVFFSNASLTDEYVTTGNFYVRDTVTRQTTTYYTSWPPSLFFYFFDVSSPIIVPATNEIAFIEAWCDSDKYVPGSEWCWADAVFTHVVASGDYSMPEDRYRLITDADSELGQLPWTDYALCGFSVSGDGRYFTVALRQEPEGPNNTIHILRGDRWSKEIKVLAPGEPGEAADGDSCSPDLSADGSVMVFDSAATNLVSSDDNLRRDVFLLQSQPESLIAGTMIFRQSGWVTDIVITADTGQEALVDQDGNFVLRDLPAGLRTITPTKEGYAFLPAKHSVFIPPGGPDMNFVVVPEGEIRTFYLPSTFK